MGTRGPIPRRRAPFRPLCDLDSNGAAPSARPKPLPPDKPEWLTPHAGELWDQLAPRLLELGVLADVDGPALACLCESFAVWRESRAALTSEGVSYTARDSGLQKRHPAAAVASQAAKDLLAWLKEFALTPAARARLNIEPADDDDASDDGFFDGSALG
jgi:P27 family predicted phage terminase small subunit